MPPGLLNETRDNTHTNMRARARTLTRTHSTPYRYTCTHAYAHIYIYIYTCTHACTHTHSLSLSIYIYIYIHAHTHTLWYACGQAHAHIRSVDKAGRSRFTGNVRDRHMDQAWEKKVNYIVFCPRFASRTTRYRCGPLCGHNFIEAGSNKNSRQTALIDLCLPCLV